MDKCLQRQDKLAPTVRVQVRAKKLRRVREELELLEPLGAGFVPGVAESDSERELFQPGGTKVILRPKGHQLQKVIPNGNSSRSWEWQ